MGGEAGANILIKGHRCYRCGHEWRPNSLEELPKVCPKCKSPYWTTPRKNRPKKRTGHAAVKDTKPSNQNSSREGQ
jgi:predicted  nucleic acid-binding Zn-ribbon protein